MTGKARCALVILTWNEIDGVTALFDRLPLDSVDECFVVDGGSTDGTIQFFEERDIPVILQNVKGRGEAFRLAVDSTDCDYLVFYSPDGNENPEDISRLKNTITSGVDMVICSRFLPEGGNEEDDLVFPWRAWANRAFTMIANLIWRGRLTDRINGFRAVSRDAFFRLKPDGSAYVIEYQLSIRALKLRLSITEIPTLEG